MTNTSTMGNHLNVALKAFKDSHSIRALCERLGKKQQYNTIKAKFNPARNDARLNIEELVEFTLATGDYSMINGVCKEVGLSQPMPINLNSKANLNEEFLVAAKALGDIAGHINVPKLSANRVTPLIASVQSLVASAMTIGYVAEERFGGMSMTMLFGDLATSGLV